MIAGFGPVLEMNLVPMGTNEFSPQLVRLVANERHRQSHPYSRQKLGRRNQSAVSSELFPSFMRRSFPAGIRDGGYAAPYFASTLIVEGARFFCSRESITKDSATVEGQARLGTVPTDEFIDGMRIRFLLPSLNRNSVKRIVVVA